MSRNAEVARLLEEYADLLDARRVEYKPRSYRRAAENIRESPDAVEDLAAEGQGAVERIEGVGDAISGKIVEYFETGRIAELEAERERLPVEMAELTAVEGVGPRTVGDLYEALGVRTLDDLEAAAREERIREVSGYGPKTEANILDNVDFAREAQERELLGATRPIAEEMLAYFADIPEAEAAELAGSIRRWKPTIGDVDVLVASDDHPAIIDAFTDWSGADSVIEAGTNKASVRASGYRVDLRVVVPEEFGSALQHFTGSKEHNVRLRNYAIERGYKINEYGVFDVRERSSAGRSDAIASDDVANVADPGADQRAGERVGGETEESVYAALDLPWIPPELREDRGEIDAAVRDALPDLVEETDVRGDLHMHTEWSDGNDTVAEMVAGAAEFGHEYVCISDHASGPGIVSGLDDAELREQLDRIREVADAAPIEVLAGVEANIDADGGITVGDDVLADLDLVVASVHSAMNMDGEAATERLITAVEHPSVDVIGHPSTRLINRRPALAFDVERVAAAAAEHGTALEVNANPARLDLWGSAVHTAVEAGATVVADTDAHSPAEFANMRYGVHTARRGWAEVPDVLNAWPVEDVREFVH